LLKSYEIPIKLVDVLRTAVIDKTSHPEWFEVFSGIKQGCGMPSFLFTIVID